MKKALAVISFGTTYPDARKAITRIEDELRAALPDYDFYRAFTSSIVRKRIEREEGVRVPSPAELMETLLAAGYTEVRCQSLHVMPGIEYEKMCGELALFREKFEHFALGAPLLATPGDCRAVCEGLLAELPVLGEDEAWVYMGHGTEHFANAVYSEVENQFRALGAERVYVGTVEGFPGLDYLRARLAARRVKKVTLAPLMIVAGDHAQNDLAGGGDDSWKSILLRDGYAVDVKLRGLGDIAAVRARFAAHCREAE